MINIIEINPAYRQIAQLLDGRRTLDVSQNCGLRFKRKRNKPTEAPRFVLKLAELAQVIDALLQRFDVSVKHRARAVAAHLMPGPVNVEPFLGGLFAATNTITHFGVEDFRATACNRTQSMSPQKLQRIFDRHLKNPLGQMTDLDCGKSFDVQTRVECAQSIQQIQIPLLL
jgi:hypothetical protein